MPSFACKESSRKCGARRHKRQQLRKQAADHRIAHYIKALNAANLNDIFGAQVYIRLFFEGHNVTPDWRY